MTSRRRFNLGITKAITAGVLTHFKALADISDPFGSDICASGYPIDDLCLLPYDADNCPGEMPPADACPSDGNRSDDKCKTGLKSADICNEASDPASDQCESGLHDDDDDLCASNKHPDDKCNSGTPEQDKCPPDGGIADGDACYGGGATTPSGEVLDTCLENGTGDECPKASFWPFGDEDDCKKGEEDECTPFDDDTCYLGTTVPGGTEGTGGLDECVSKGLGGTSYGSDQCNDGSPEQDECTDGSAYGIANGLYDHCPGGATDVDTCDPTAPVLSDDYCLGGDPNNDECKPPIDPDECPGGKSDVDDCPTGLPSEDVCTAEGGCAGGDQEGSSPEQDECDYQPTDACTVFNPDGAE